MEIRSKTSKTSVGNDRTPFQSTPKPPFKRLSMETLEREAVDHYDEKEDESISSSLDSDSDSDTDYESVNTEDMSPEEMVEIPAEQREEETEREPSPEEKNEKPSPRRGLVDYFPSAGDGKRRVTRSMVEKKEKVVVWTGYEEEPFRKVDPAEFYSAMDAVEAYDEDEDEDVEMDDSDEVSESGTDYESVNTEDMSPEDIEETHDEERDGETEWEQSPGGTWHGHRSARKSHKPLPLQCERSGLVDYFPSTEDGKRVTRSMVEKKEKVQVVTGYEEEPFKKVDPTEFYAAMDAVEAYDEDEDDDVDMDDSDETSESGADDDK